MAANRRKVPEITDEVEARIQRGIARDPDSRELSDEQLAAMRPASEMLPPALYAALTKPRGRPKADETKMPIKLRLDRGAVKTFKATGPGWQTRMNAALVRAAKRLDASLAMPLAGARKVVAKKPAKVRAARKKRATG